MVARALILTLETDHVIAEYMFYHYFDMANEAKIFSYT